MRTEMDGHSGMHARMAWTVDLCRTLPSELPPLLADGPIIALCLLMVSRVPVWMQQVFYGVSGVFILYLA